MPRRFGRELCGVLFLACAWASCAHAEPRLAWDPNPPEEQVQGYRVHYGPEPRGYVHTVDVGPALEWQIPELPPGPWYFAATAYNAAGESGYSNEVEWWSGSLDPPAPATGVAVEWRERPMSVSLLQPAVFAASSASPWTVAISFGNDATAGSTIVVFVRHSNPETTLTVTDSQDNTYEKDASGTFRPALPRYMAVFSCKKNLASGPLTVTVSGGTAVTRVWISEYEIDLVNGAELDVAVQSSGAAVTTQYPVSPAGTLSTPGLLFSALSIDGYASSAPDSPWVETGAGANYLNQAELIEETPVEHTANWTLPGTTSSWLVMMLGYVPAAAPQTQTRSAGLDALLWAARTQPVSLDALLRASRTQVVTVDALLRALRSGTGEVDALLQALRMGTASLDATLQAAGLASLLLDAYAQAAWLTRTAALDALLTVGAAQAAELDALLRATRTTDTALDSLLQALASAGTGLDAVLEAVAAVVELTYPEDVATGVIQPITAQWLAFDGTDAYRVEVATDDEFATVIADETVVGATQLELPELDPVQHWWRVSAGTAN